MITFQHTKTTGLRGLNLYRAEVPEGGAIYLIETGGGVAAVHVGAEPPSLETLVAAKISEAAEANEKPAEPEAAPKKKATKKKGAPKKKATK